MALQTLLYEKIGHKAVVTLNRPEVLNAINEQMEKELVQVWHDIRYDRDIRVIIITGAGDRGFCPGNDVYARDSRDMLEASPIKRTGSAPMRKIAPKTNDLWKPTIVAVNGVCAAAGMYFVAYGDIIICSENASFVEPHVNNGVTPIIECLLLHRMGVPLPWVMRMGLLGRSERISAERAMEWGLVTEIIPRDKLLERAHELADTIADNAPFACHALVKGVWEGLDLGLRQAVEQGWWISEMHDQYSGESTEGMEAFIQKRRPDWSTAKASRRELP